MFLCRSLVRSRCHLRSLRLTQKAKLFYAMNYLESKPPRKVKKAVKNLMFHSKDSWTIINLSNPIFSSTFAAFIRKIEPCNASSIRRLELQSSNTGQASFDLFLATQLCAYHLPNLENLELYVVEKPIFLVESPDYYHPDRSSPFWANGPVEPVYRTVKMFVDRVH